MDDPPAPSAVPGCAGKGVIDLLIPYGEGDLEPVKNTLQEPGFQRQSTRNARRKREILQGGTTDTIDYSIIKGAFVQEALDEKNR